MSSHLQIEFGHRQHHRQVFIEKSTDVAWLYDTQKQLKDSIASAIANLQGPEPNVTKALEELANAKVDAAHTGSFIEDCWNLIPGNCKPTVESAHKAQEVFNTPELVEHILSFLNAGGILTAMHVQHSMRAAVTGSLQLKKQLGLVVDPDVPFRFTIDNYCSAEIQFKIMPHYDARERGWLSHHETPPPDAVEQLTGQEFWINCGEYTGLHKMGTRLRAMSICMPPAQSVDVMAHCRKSYYAERVSQKCCVSSNFSAAPGSHLTFGDIKTLCDNVKADHEQTGCEHGPMKIDFYTRATMSEIDPLLIKRRKKFAEGLEAARAGLQQR